MWSPFAFQENLNLLAAPAVPLHPERDKDNPLLPLALGRGAVERSETG